MVPSELTRRVGNGGVIILLDCWKWGPYGVPDQQGDEDKIFWLRKNGYIEWIQHVSTYRGPKYTEPPGEREQKLEVEKKTKWLD